MLYLRGGIAEVKYTGEEAAAEVNKLLKDVVDNEDEFQPWEDLVLRASNLEGGVNRNSSPDSIDLVRKVFDAFLSKFPLYFAYWKKYADREFAIGGTEAAEMVYERGVSCNLTSVDLWTEYCQFKMETCHQTDIVRELFERASHFVHLDFQCAPFWDKYIEFEERQNEQENVTKIYARAFQSPSAALQKYYEKFRTRISTRPVEELVEKDLLHEIQAKVQAEYPGLAALDLDRQYRNAIDLHYYRVYELVQAEAVKRWTFETSIKRAYFHVTALEDTDLENWRKYLDFEESQGDFHRTAFLYERCLVTCALYEEFWLRYARWMFKQSRSENFCDSKDENTRLIYMRASCIFVSIDLVTIRLHWARFEEKLGRTDVAEDIHKAILQENPGNVETIISLAGLKRRQGGDRDAVEYLREQIGLQDDVEVSGHLVAEQARIYWQCQNDVGTARDIFQAEHESHANSRPFWKSWLDFETNQPVKTGKPGLVNDLIRDKSKLPSDYRKELSEQYMQYLLKCGDKQSVTKYMVLDKEVNGSYSIPGQNLEGSKDVEPQSGSANGDPKPS